MRGFFFILASVAAMSVLSSCQNSDTDSSESAISIPIEDGDEVEEEVSCPEPSSNIAQSGSPSILGIHLNMNVNNAESILSCAGYSVSPHTASRVFISGGVPQTITWRDRITGSKTSDNETDIVNVFFMDADGVVDVFAVDRNVEYKHSMPSFNMINDEFTAFYANGDVYQDQDMSEFWSVTTTQGPAIRGSDEYGSCKPLVSSSRRDCLTSYGFRIERFRGEPDSVIRFRVAMHDYEADRAAVQRRETWIQQQMSSVNAIEDRRAADPSRMPQI